MDKGNYGYLANKGIVLIAFYIGVSSQAFADEALGSSIDCSKIEIDYVDSPELTQRERLEAMNNAFFESVNRFELCNLSTQSSPESETSSQVQPPPDAGFEETKESEDSSDAVLESVASPSMTGTESEESTAAVFDSSEEAATIKKEIDGSIVTYSSGANGTIPKDIPKVNNDDAVAAQIRVAAEIETDPVKKEKLWNEYRKYKGLPVKKDD